MKSRQLCFVLRASCMAFCAAVALPVLAATYYVDAEKGDDGYDGTSPTVDGEGIGPKKTWEACKELLTAEKDELVFAKGRYPVETEWRPTVKNISFRGATGDRDDVILDGQGATRFIVNLSANCQYNFYHLTVSNFWAGTKTFEDAKGYNGGFCHTRSSGTSDNGSNLYFTNVHATCCSAPLGAGGIGYARQIETHDSLFDFNAAENGGAFATSGNSGGTYFHDSTFRTNSAAVKSGVVYAYAAAAPFRAYGSRFEGNTAGNTGVANFHATLVTNCWFVGNAATNGNAGVLTLGISNSKEVYPLTDNYFVGNTATGSGGAVEITSPNWALVRCHFNTNSCCSSGGAVTGAASGPNSFPLIDGCTFVGNRAGGVGMTQGASGGALSVTVTHVINSTFVGNESAFMGGAISPRASNVNGTDVFIGGYPQWTMVSNCVFRGNKAHGMAYRANWPCGGGAIDYGTGASGNNYPVYNVLPLHDCVFEDNEVDNTLNTYSGCTFAGGAVYAPNGVDMRKCVFRRNVNHVGAAGAIFARSYAPGITDTLFESNVAQVAAGALCMEYVEKGKTCIVSNCTFDGNCAIGTRGGAMVFSQCGLELSDCTFRGNSVVTNGAPASGLLGGAALAIGGNAGWCSSSGYGKSSVRGTDPELKIDFTIERCTFQENDAFAAGGGIFFADQQGIQAMTGTVRNCLFAGNVSRQVPTYKTAQTAAGAAIRQSYASVSIENCTFAGNTVVDDKDKMQGGAIYVATTMPGLTNCVFYGNADGKTGTTYDDIYTTDASKVGYCFAKPGGLLTDKENGNIVSDANPFRSDDHTDYAVRKDCGSAAGINDLDWMTPGSLDCGGKPRLAKDGTVDMGCYQFWRKPGLLLFVW